MKKFLKNNKLPIFLLMCVIGLSIFYCLEPTNNTDNDVVVNNNVSSNYYYFDEERLSILETRNALINELEASVCASNNGINDVSKVLEEIDNIYNITNLECMLELEIESLGYDDVLVYNYQTSEDVGSISIVLENIDIKILASSIDTTKAVAICQLAKTTFGNNDYRVSLILESNNIA